MKRIRIIGLCLVAAFAISMVAAGSASAAAPEYGRCVKVAGGLYENAGCTKLGGPKKYEWYPGPGPKNKFTQEFKPGTEVKLEGIHPANKVKCAGEIGEGFYSTAKNVVPVFLYFSGCTEAGGNECKSPLNVPGVIETRHEPPGLEGELGWEKAPLTVGNALFPAAHVNEAFAEFECVGVKYVVEGTVLTHGYQAGTMRLNDTLQYVEVGGHQHPERFEGGPLAVLKWKIGAALPEAVGLKLTTIQTNEEKIEVNRVV